MAPYRTDAPIAAWGSGANGHPAPRIKTGDPLTSVRRVKRFKQDHGLYRMVSQSINYSMHQLLSNRTVRSLGLWIWCSYSELRGWNLPPLALSPGGGRSILRTCVQS